MQQQQAAYVLENIDDWQKFIDNNYHQLSRRIRVESLLPRLRSANVINLEDQEIILHTYLTTFLKAGHLLDIVKMKGRAGFDHFMEAIEYEFPDVYKETTGRQPRPNPDRVDSKRRAAGASSILVLDKMGDLIHTFTDQLSRKHLELRQFEDLVQQLKAELMKQTDEQKILDDQIRNLEDTVKELRDEKEDMAENLTKERMLREDFEEKYDQLRSRNLFEMYKLTQQPLIKSVSLNPRPGASPMTSSLSSSSSSSSLSPPTTSNRSSSGKFGTVRRLKDAYEQGKSTPCQPEAEAEAEVDKTKTGTGSETERSSDKVAELEENYSRLQESYDRLQCCIDEFKKDAEQCRAKQLDVESSSRETNAENEKLKAEMRKMEDQCKLMAEMIRRLKDEIDARPEKPNKLKMHKMFSGSSSEEEPRPSTDTGSASASVQTMGRRTPVGTLPRPRPGLQNRAGSNESTPVTNTLVHSSLGLLVSPLNSFDSN